VVALLGALDDALRGPLDALGIRHGGPAELHDNRVTHVAER
jgi:hypothetical protein